MPTLARIFKMKEMRETSKKAPQQQEVTSVTVREDVDDLTKAELGKLLDDQNIEYSPQQRRDELIELLLGR